MNCHFVRRFACLLLVLSVASCVSSAQTAIPVGQCSYTWLNNCSGASPTLCGANGCTVSIADVNGSAVAMLGTNQATYLCVEPSTTVKWVDAAATSSFVVNFGTSR